MGEPHETTAGSVDEGSGHEIREAGAVRESGLVVGAPVADQPRVVRHERLARHRAARTARRVVPRGPLGALFEQHPLLFSQVPLHGKRMAVIRIRTLEVHRLTLEFRAHWYKSGQQAKQTDHEIVKATDSER